MKLEEILKILGNMSEKEFLTLSENDWKQRVEEKVSDTAQKSALLNYSNEASRRTLFANTLVEEFPPASSSPKPTMNLRRIYNFLGRNNVGQLEFLTMSRGEWKKLVNSAVAQKRTTVTSEQDRKSLAECQAFLLDLTEINKRKKFFVAQTELKYKPLQVDAEGTAANIAAKNENNPANTLAAQGNSSSLYTIKGDTPEEIAKNKKAIFEKHTNTLKAYYNSGKMTDEEKNKYDTEEKFLAAFKPQEDVYFKDFAALEKSNVSDEYKELCKNQKDKFPMTLTVLPFPNPKEQGMKFMDEITQAGHIKPLPPAAKEEKKDEKEEKTTPNTGP